MTFDVDLCRPDDAMIITTFLLLMTGETDHIHEENVVGLIDRVVNDIGDLDLDIREDATIAVFDRCAADLRAIVHGQEVTP